MDKNKKIEDFFKKRVNDLETPDDGWDRPGAAVFENAQQHFPKYPTKKKQNRKVILITLTAVLVLSLLGYIYHMTKSVEALKSQLQVAQMDLQNSNHQFNEAQNQLSNEIAILKSKNEIAENTITVLTEQQVASKDLINKKDSKISQLLLEKNSIKKEYNRQLSSGNSRAYDLLSNEQNNIDPKVPEQTTIVTPLTSLNLLESQTLDNTKANLWGMPQIVSLVKPKPKQKRIEIGLYYSSLNYEILTAYEFSKLESVEKKAVKGYTARIFTPRLHLAYAISPNLWITTGFRKSYYDLNEKFISTLIYDKSGEYVDEEGKTINEFVINSHSTFSEAENKISLEVPDGTDIASGEALVSYWNHVQKFQFVQIPLGLEYFIGKKKWQWNLKGGLGWNKVRFGNYFIDGTIKYENEDIAIDDNEKKKSQETSTQFLSGYAGLGLNYSLTKNWSLRTSLIAERNFIKPKKDFSNQLTSNHLNHVLELGLNYRF